MKKPPRSKKTLQPALRTDRFTAAQLRDLPQFASRHRSSSARAKRQVLTEHDEQVAVMRWAAAHLAQFPELELLHAIPNGGHRAAATAAALKAEGVKPGVSDLFLPVARQGFHGLYIEMKAADGTLRAEQRQFLDAVRAQGYRAEVCKTAAPAIALLSAYLGNE